VFYRWKPRDAEALCKKNHVPPRVHRTVCERIARATDGYSPGSLPVDPEIVSIREGSSVTDRLRAEVSNAHVKIGCKSAVESQLSLIRAGTAAYALFLVSVILLAGMALLRLAAGAAVPTTNWQWIKFTLAVTLDYWPVSAVGILAFVGLHEVESALDNAYSEFWHQARREFGKIFKTHDPQPAPLDKSIGAARVGGQTGV
jgi:hypothetical protein